jgi:hypothetical protein
MRIYGELVFISGDINVPVKSFTCMHCGYVGFDWKDFQDHYYQNHGVTLPMLDGVLIVPFSNQCYLICSKG